jgi:DNA-binding NarL/FixJ family response regulator
MYRQCGGNTDLLRAYRKLFDSFIWSRRQMVDRAKVLASQAAVEFAGAGGPLIHALALEAGGLSDEARRVLRRCGASPGSVRPKWSGSPIPRRLASELTPRESEIAKYAAEGLSNRAIAQVLGLSERTVHHHCEAVLGKLGIKSRWQLSSAVPWALK